MARASLETLLDPQRAPSNADQQLTQLKGLVYDRERLLRTLSGVLRRAGPHELDRNIINKQRAVKRRAARKALRRNAEAIAALIMEIYVV